MYLLEGNLSAIQFDKHKLNYTKQLCIIVFLIPMLLEELYVTIL